MSKSEMRVVLASDQPEIRRLLARVVKQKMGGVVVGEGENAIRALRLTRQLRPDIAIIDSYLPHQVGLNNVPLSRNAGLDTAQAICAEIPDVRVVLIDSAHADSFYPTGMEDLRLRPSPSQTGTAAGPADTQCISFASLQTRPIPRQKPGFSTICITVGTCGLLLGLALTATMFLANAGLPLIALGFVSLVIGCAGKLVAASRSETNPPEDQEQDGSHQEATRDY